jgi:hypothetical protein
MPEQNARAAEIARLEQMRAMSERMGSGYRDRIAEIDKRLAKLREAQS